MKNITKLAAAIALVSSSIAAPVMAEGSFSANAGLVSEYYFRGVAQTEDASASAGIDYENSGFYVGAWTADVNDGLEVDGYLGYGIETDSGIGANLGFTTYQYTGQFDTQYNEVNLGLSYSFASIEYSVGTREGDAGLPDEDYTFAALTLEHNGFYGLYGSWGDQFKGDYAEVGYGAEVGGFDLGISFIFNDKELTKSGKKDENIIFSLSKSFEL